MPARGPDYRQEEDDFLRAHYVKRGARWCAERMPGRSVHSLTKRVRVIGVARKDVFEKAPTSDWIDAQIRRAYTGERPTGFVTACAKAVGRSRYWVAKRALELGLIKSRDQRPWSDAELEYASKWPLISPVELSRRMRRLGYHRTPGAIAYMRTEGKIATTDDAQFTAAGLAEAMGVMTATVTGWVNKGLLRASRRGWNRTSAQNGDGYIIHERDVAAFIVQHTAYISLAKLEPNKFWLVDLLVRCGAPATATGRQKRSASDDSQEAA
ncbi:hypothetical protein ACXR8U_13905 [Methylobacterium radiotolerans]|jgi:hypothetical protein|uniref:hypothetical protein n=1 Tax=Methylobacterium TaxID=407 RepID=UPI0005E8C76C|nr:MULTISPECIES: hypothetical protein [Methylobacterium]MBN6821729.1 hypothetical protein [Methylobacterium organophilum]OXE40279.1 hypothetical protein CCS92_19785 [Methylobacterium radiotolerans]GAN49677.1 hypothetical protein ME121_3708 [Methylobacterium sp. ME121]